MNNDLLMRIYNDIACITCRYPDVRLDKADIASLLGLQLEILEELEYSEQPEEQPQTGGNAV